jgi:cyclohexanone monooxygenase
MSLSEKERSEQLDEHGFDFIRKFIDVGMDPMANETMCELYRSQLKKVFPNNPVVAEKLSPRGYPLGCKRQVIDTNYFATFSRENVSLVDLRNGGGIQVDDSGINSINSDGVEEKHELDALVFATGFDAMTGPLMKLNLQGRNGMLLSEVWREGPSSYLGLQIAGFPNLFTINGPGSPSVLSNMICSIEQHVNFISTLISRAEESKVKTVECSLESQEEWSHTVTKRAEPTMLMSPSCKSWYLGSNVKGKSRKFMIYLGVGEYREVCDEIEKSGYPGFLMKK